MYKKHTYSWLKHWDFILLDILCMEIAYWVACLARNGSKVRIHFPVYFRASIALLFINICVVFFIQSYKRILKKSRAEEIRAATIHVTCVVLVMLVYLYMVQDSFEYSRTVYILFWIFYLALTILIRMARKKALLSTNRQNMSTRSLLVVTGENDSENVLETVLHNNVDNLRVVGIAFMDGQKSKGAAAGDISGADINAAGDGAGDQDAGETEEINGVPIVATGRDILEYIKSNWVDEVFICPPEGRKVPKGLTRGCEAMGITIHLKIADPDDLSLGRTVEKLGGYTVLTESIHMETASQAFFKRLLDIIGGIVGIIITGIAFIFVAPAIEAKSPGPVFFKQTRIGRNGKEFQLYKFRSMYVDAEERKEELMARNEVKDGMMFKIENDPRIIPGIGHLIRRSSIDELPQFWNVLKGDMSLVGTRPPTPEEYAKYEYHHRKRLAIRPGITGLWQVSGRSDIKDFEEVVKLDTQYIREWTLGLDIRILIKTVKVVFQHAGAE
ncbi:MAG: sugar transferase [Clostridiales bacterium]|nr:sugar transferase [Clostridiales bacterium]